MFKSKFLVISIVLLSFSKFRFFSRCFNYLLITYELFLLDAIIFSWLQWFSRYFLITSSYFLVFLCLFIVPSSTSMFSLLPLFPSHFDYFLVTSNVFSLLQLCSYFNFFSKPQNFENFSLLQSFSGYLNYFLVASSYVLVISSLIENSKIWYFFSR